MLDTYAKLSKDLKPDMLVRRAVKILGRKGTALDIGAGSLRNTRFLLDSGFEVIAFDKDPIILEIAEEIQNDALEANVSDISDYEFTHKYDLIISINVLSFLGKEALLNFIPKMKNALLGEGVLCVTLFGDVDGWSDKESMSFFTREEVQGMFDDMNTVMFSEEEWDGETIQGDPKHWHLFRTIVKRR